MTTFTVSATNAGGSGTIQVTITVEPRAPVIASYTVSTATYKTNVAIANNAPTLDSTTGDAPTGYTIAPALPTGLVLHSTTGVVSGTPTQIISVTTFTVSATNAGGTGTRSITIAVEPRSPVITSYAVTAATYPKGVAIADNTPTLDMAAGDAPTGYTIAPDLPAGLAIHGTTGDISGTPTQTIAATTFTVTASNAGTETISGTSSIDITITVYEDSRPILNSYSVNPVTCFNGDAIDTNSPTVTGGAASSFSVSPSLPAGLTLSTSTGVITGTPTGVPTSRTDYTVTVTNNVGSTNLQVSIKVASKTGIMDCMARDFISSTNWQTWGGGVPTGTKSHPDFEVYSGSQKGMVGTTLSAGNKPVCVKTSKITTCDTFDQWYANVPGTNKEVPLLISMTWDAGSKAYKYSSNSFFPLTGDARGFDDKAMDGNSVMQNFYFTLECTSMITYYGGETFEFTGDDDLWVFINKERVIDLGGVHGPESSTVRLDDLGLTKGQSYSFHLFFAERHTTGSNFIVTSTFDVVMPTAPSLDGYSLSPATYIKDTPIADDNTPVVSGGVSSSFAITPALPAGITFSLSTGVIRGTPTGESAETVHSITATNPGGSSTFALTVTVGATPTKKPVITGYTLTTATYSTYNVVTDNVPALDMTAGDAVSSWTIAPSLSAGLSIDESTGTISGNPTSAAATAAYTVSATNVGGVSTIVVTITVEETISDPPVLGAYTHGTSSYAVDVAIAQNSHIPGGRGTLLLPSLPPPPHRPQYPPHPGPYLRYTYPSATRGDVRDYGEKCGGHQQYGIGGDCCGRCDRSSVQRRFADRT